MQWKKESDSINYMRPRETKKKTQYNYKNNNKAYK